MAYTVFLSHSMTHDDESFVRQLADTLSSQKINCYIAERDHQFGNLLALKIEQALRSCDCLVALVTQGGSRSAYVNQEIGAAVGMGKPVIPIVERGVTLKGFKEGVEWIEFDRANPQGCLLKLAPHMVGLAAAKEKANFITLIVIGALIWWLFSKAPK